MAHKPLQKYAFVSKDPNNPRQIWKLHLRWLWDWEKDERFLLDVKKGKKVVMKEGAEKWQHTQKGVTFTLGKLTAFLDNELADLLLVTFLDETVQQAPSQRIVANVRVLAQRAVQ